MAEGDVDPGRNTDKDDAGSYKLAVAHAPGQRRFTRNFLDEITGI